MTILPPAGILTQHTRCVARVGWLAEDFPFDNHNRIGTKDVVRYEAAMLSFLRSDKPEILKAIRDTKALDDDTSKALKDALTEFGKTFA